MDKNKFLGLEIFKDILLISMTIYVTILSIIHFNVIIDNFPTSLIVVLLHFLIILFVSLYRIPSLLNNVSLLIDINHNENKTKNK